MSEKCHNGPTSEAAFEGRILKVFIHWNNSVRKRGSLQQSKRTSSIRPSARARNDRLLASFEWRDTVTMKQYRHANTTLASQ